MTDINSYNPNGRTQLMEAVYEQDVDRVRELIKNGANINITDENFGTSTALTIAKRELKIKDTDELRQIVLLLMAGKDDSSPSVKISSNAEIVELLNSIHKQLIENNKSNIFRANVPIQDLVLLLVKIGFAAIPAVIIIYIAILISTKII